MLSLRRKEGGLGNDVIQDRLARLGTVEFEEITSVLRQENFLLPPAENGDVYEEFVCLYLELRHFLPHLLPRYFPSIADFARVDELIAQDVDGVALFTQTKLPGAQEPSANEEVEQQQAAHFENATGEKPDAKQYQALMNRANQVAARGNIVRAALCRQRAFELAPQGGPGAARDAITEALCQLTSRLQQLAPADEQQRADWVRGLRGLLASSNRGIWPVESRLLFDLQNACVDYERTIYSVDLLEWLRHGCQGPLKRELSNLKFTLPIAHLRKAEERLVSARLTHEARQAITPLVRATLARLERESREHLRPLVLRSLREAGFHAANPTEALALDRMVDELVDQAIDRGFLTMSDLRDAIARGALKLPDLTGPRVHTWRQGAGREPALSRPPRRHLSRCRDLLARPAELELRSLRHDRGTPPYAVSDLAFPRCVHPPEGCRGGLRNTVQTHELDRSARRSHARGISSRRGR